MNELKEIQDRVIKKSKKIKKIFYPIYISILLIAIGALLYFKLWFLIFHAIFIISFFAFVIFSIIKTCKTSKDTKLFEKKFHKVFVETSLKEIFKDAEFNENGFNEKFIEALGFINTCDRYDSNDYVKGTYHGINFEQADMHIEERREDRDKDGHTRTYYETMFRGRFMIYDFNKPFKSNISVSTAGMAIDTLDGNKKFVKVKLDDSNFNKNFIVYAESEHDAFYLLTPHFMERIKKLYSDTQSGLLLYFVDSKLYIAINNNKDAFEYDIYKPINEKEIKDNIIKDINVILKFIDDLNLENDLFKK